jgi:hypothetical protein
MNEQQREQWLSILGKTKIDKRHYDKVVSYIDSYIVNENLYGHMSEPISKKEWEDLEEKVIPLSLKVFEEIDLDKVEFIGYPIDIDTIEIKIHSDKNIDYNVVYELSHDINEKINNGYKVKIYRVINTILKKDDVIEVFSRMKFIN